MDYIGCAGTGSGTADTGTDCWQKALPGPHCPAGVHCPAGCCQLPGANVGSPASPEEGKEEGPPVSPGGPVGRPGTPGAAANCGCGCGCGSSCGCCGCGCVMMAAIRCTLAIRCITSPCDAAPAPTCMHPPTDPPPTAPPPTAPPPTGTMHRPVLSTHPPPIRAIGHGWRATCAALAAPMTPAWPTPDAGMPLQGAARVPLQQRRSCASGR